MKRRNLIAHGGAVLFGSAIFGQPNPIPVITSPTPLPKRLSLADVEQVRTATATLRALAREFGGQADSASAAANRALELLAVPGDEAVKAALGAAVANLLTVAGWCCVDSGRYDPAYEHFGTAMSVAGEFGDQTGLASALRHAGIAMFDQGAYNDSLSACQVGLMKVSMLDEQPARETTAALHAQSAHALAAMDQPEAARRALATARDGSHPPDSFAAADMDLVSSLVSLQLGQLDIAESFAATSVRMFGTSHRRDGVESDIALARIHVQAREPDGAALSQRAIEGVTSMRSTRARKLHLVPLGKDLAARRDSTCQDLAQRLRRIVTAA